VDALEVARAAEDWLAFAQAGGRGSFVRWARDRGLTTIDAQRVREAVQERLLQGPDDPGPLAGAQ